MAVVGAPTHSDTVRQTFLVEPLVGPRDTFYYLERFPDEIYNKSPDSHLYKFMRTLLGEGGTNWLKKNHLEARLLLEELGIEMFDLDKFFGNPLAFGRILEEEFEEDPYGIIDHDVWEQIKAKNARYRGRALNFVNGARAGNTPHGMRLVAQAGLGHDVEIIENYKYLFDAHSDDPLGLHYMGKTLSTEEMIVLPRREVGISEEQRISVHGHPELPDSGNFYLVYNGINSSSYNYTYEAPGEAPVVLSTIPWNATRDHVRLALAAIPEIGENVEAHGGPLPTRPITVQFTGDLSNKDVPQLEAVSSLAHTTATTEITIHITTVVGGRESVDEAVVLPAKDQYSLQSAVDRIRPQTTIMTLGEARGLRSRNDWNDAYSSSEYTEVIRYVTGSSTVPWPPPSTQQSVYWIESDKEKAGPRINNDLQYHHTGFHDVSSVEASSVLEGTRPIQAFAAQPEPIFITSATEKGTGGVASFINGIYPLEYKDLPGVPNIENTGETAWSSAIWAEDEWLIFRMPFVRCVNYISFDIVREPIQMDIDFDAHDGASASQWIEATRVQPYHNIMTKPLDQSENKWASVGLTFTNAKNQLIFTRALRLRLTRLENYTGAIQVRNLRIARNVS